MPFSGRRGVREAALSTPSVTMSTSRSTARSVVTICRRCSKLGARNIASTALCTRHWLARLPRLVAISGEAGVGKSALLRQLAPEVRLRGGTLVTGRCHEADVQPPYGPWAEVIDALRRRGAAPADVAWRELPQLVLAARGERGGEVALGDGARGQPEPDDAPAQPPGEREGREEGGHHTLPRHRLAHHTIERLEIDHRLILVHARDFTHHRAGHVIRRDAGGEADQQMMR